MSEPLRPTTSRRQVLRGAGGLTLGLPFLPSLLPREARAQSRLPGPRFVAMATDHGALRGSNMYPGADGLTDRMEVYPGHTIARGSLQRRLAGTSASLSPVLTAPATLLSDRLVRKLNVLRGLDINFYIAHHRGGHLGNFAGTSGGTAVKTPIVTIDQVMAYSPAFYRSLEGVRQRVIAAGQDMSYSQTNPTARTGPVTPVRATRSPTTLFDQLVGVPQTTTTTTARKPIADLVLEDYKRLRDGNRRLSMSDRRRLDDHIGRLDDIQRRLRAQTRTCAGSTRPPNGLSDGTNTTNRAFYQSLNDVIVASFICGTSRIAVVHASSGFHDYTGDWHQDVAHKFTLSDPQRLLVEANQRFFEWVFMDLLAKLDVDEGEGTSYLDNTLVAWTQESGYWTHNAQGMPVVTAGGASGFLKTGQFIDYRNQTMGHEVKMTDTLNIPFEEKYEWPGLTFRQWLGTALQAMRVPRAEYEQPDRPGYGDPYSEAQWNTKYVPGVFANAGSVLPLLRA
jgi:hypothetical protein